MIVAELWGVLEGLVVAKRLGARPIEINVDSIDEVNGIKNHKVVNPIGRALMSKIREYYELDWDIEVRHVFREDNYCADAHAKRGMELPEDYCFFDSCPPWMRHLVDADLLGTPVSRFVVVCVPKKKTQSS